MLKKTASQNLILDYIVGCESCNEYQLMTFIKNEIPAFFTSLGVEPSLFKKHFFLFSHLYRLNDQLATERMILEISALDIRVIQNENEIGRKIGHIDTLKEFYLNEDNLKLSDQEIERMMNGFWQKYLALDNKASSLKILGLENETNLTITILKTRYNELANLHHPDKGGDSSYFVEIKNAYGDARSLF